jgi:sec-independent protein translocase protein TatC
MNFWRKLLEFRESRDEPKPFIDHLEDLRRMLIKMVAVLTVMVLLCFVFRTSLANLLQHPLQVVDPVRAANLQSLGVADSMTVSFQMSFYAGLVLSFPLLILFLSEFILPALTPREKRFLFPAGTFCTLLFLGGAAFAYFVVLPDTLAFFFRDARSMHWEPTWTVREYYTFVTQFVIAFGLAFELPLAVLLIVRLGWVNVAFLRKTRAFALIIILVLAAIIAPTPDLFTFFLMAAPMYALYEICIWIAAFVEKKSGKKWSNSLE